MSGISEQIDDIGDGGRHPSTPLVEELIESLGRIGQSVRGSTVIDSVAFLQEKRTQPAILSLVILNVVRGFRCLVGIATHNVVVHEGGASEE